MAATYVFGSPITDAPSLSLIPPVQRNSTDAPKRRAERAMGTRLAYDKYVEAREAVDRPKEEYGSGICTLGLIYNGTGDAIIHAGGYDWEGLIYGRSSCPAKLEGGQWGVFLHVQSRSGGGSVGAVVDRGKDKSGTDYDHLLAWYNRPNEPNLMKDSERNSRETGNGCQTIVKIEKGEHGASKFEGILTLDHVI